MPMLVHKGPQCSRSTGSGQPCQLDAGHEPRQCWSCEGYRRPDERATAPSPEATCLKE